MNILIKSAATLALILFSLQLSLAKYPDNCGEVASQILDYQQKFVLSSSNLDVGLDVQENGLYLKPSSSLETHSYQSAKFTTYSVIDKTVKRFSNYGQKPLTDSPQMISVAVDSEGKAVSFEHGLVTPGASPAARYEFDSECYPKKIFMNDGVVVKDGKACTLVATDHDCAVMLKGKTPPLNKIEVQCPGNPKSWTFTDFMGVAKLNGVLNVEDEVKNLKSVCSLFKLDVTKAPGVSTGKTAGKRGIGKPE